MVSGYPTFQVAGGSPIDLKLTFQSAITNHTVIVSDWDAGASEWDPRTPYVVTNAVAHDPVAYGLGVAAVGSTILLTISLAMTSIGGTSAVSTVADLSQAGTSKGEVSTPPVTPSANQAATVILQIYLKGV